MREHARLAARNMMRTDWLTTTQTRNSCRCSRPGHDSSPFRMHRLRNSAGQCEGSGQTRRLGPDRRDVWLCIQHVWSSIGVDAHRIKKPQVQNVRTCTAIVHGEEAEANISSTSRSRSQITFFQVVHTANSSTPGCTAQAEMLRHEANGRLNEMISQYRCPLHSPLSCYA